MGIIPYNIIVIMRFFIMMRIMHTFLSFVTDVGIHQSSDRANSPELVHIWYNHGVTVCKLLV